MSTKKEKPKHKVAVEEYQDKNSEYHLPKHYDNRRSESDQGREQESPPYRVNAESICFSDSLSDRPYLDAIETTEFLLDKIASPRFHLEYKCRGCEEWKPADSRRPRRRGALDPCQSCFGCVYGHLDGGDERFSSFDRDAAANWFSKVKARQHKLRCRLADSKSEKQKKAIQKTLKWSESEERRALRACHVLGFDPRHKPRRRKKDKVTTSPPDSVLQETQDHDLEDLRQDQAVVAVAHGKIATCKSCSSWCHEPGVSESGSEMGFCWARDGTKTREDYWCPNYKFGGDR